ncbi:MAG: hypothetical protein ACC656_02375, partial [Candidatus Heimdallarchaeota archaeon]
NDAVVNRESLDIRGFVIHWSKFEEMMEDLKVRTDVDPLVTFDSIASVYEQKINLKMTKSELANAMAPGEIKENELLFSKLQKVPVYSKFDENIGIFTDIFFDENSEASYGLGGKAFLHMLRLHNCSDSLNYVVNPSEVSKTERGYKISTEIKELEYKMKQNLTNLIRDVLIEAERDGTLSQDEKQLINSIKVDLPTYEDALKKAQEDNVITKEEENELNSIKERILQNVINLARKDDLVTDDERALIRKLAGYMANRREELFWKVFGTT